MVNTSIKWNDYNDIAKIYNLAINYGYEDFSISISNQLLNYYEKTTNKNNKNYIDIGCGNGHLAVFFAQHGYNVIGLDLSEKMLDWACINNQRASTNVQFVNTDAVSFDYPINTGLITAIFNVINHIKGMNNLYELFKRIFNSLSNNGIFIGDINTSKLLKERVGTFNEEINIENQNVFISRECNYNKKDNCSYSKVTCFVNAPQNNLYTRYSNNVFNYIYNLEELKDMVLKIGFRKIEYCDLQLNPIKEPNEFNTVMMILYK